MNKIKNERIESIDALRAFALLGILLVHTSQLFNFNNENNVFPFFSEFGNHQIDFITQFFQNRFLTLFSILFGISFFLILRNPNYSQTKFCWRCILLMVFGLFNKFVYTTDVLVWYGINGIILSMLPVRRFSAKSILVLSFVTFIISFQDFINFGHFFWPEYAYSKRYLISTGITGILTFPYFEILKEDAHLFFGLGSLTLSYFLFGYYLGKSGLIERIDKVVNTKLILSSTLIFISVSCFYYSIGAPQNIKKISDLISALYYAIMYIYTIEIMLGKIHDYKVPYSQYKILRKERMEQQRSAYENQQRMIEKTEEFIDRLLERNAAEDDDRDSDHVHKRGDVPHVAEEERREHGDDDRLRTARYERREDYRHALVALVLDGPSRHNGGNAAPLSDNHRYKRLAAKPELAEEPVHDERDARHIPAVLEEGEEDEHDEDDRHEA